MTTYEQFVESKVDFQNTYGFDTTDADLNPILKPHQKDIIRWAVKGGRRAIFAAFGMGKSVIQLETLRLILHHDGQDGRALIICPLGVRIEFANDAHMLGMTTRFIRRTDEISGPGIYVTNYESVRDGRLDIGHFRAVSLDEASILRSYGSKTYQEFLTLFATTPYRYVATATPSPNRFKELIHYAGFLGIMDTGQALTRWFKRDSTKANNLTLHPHKEAEFWLWLASWAVFAQSPADLGRDTTGYDLPPLNITWHEVTPEDHDAPDYDRDGQGHLFRGVSLSLQGAAREKRRTLPARLDAAMGIVRDHLEHGSGQVIIWCDLNDEQAALEHALTSHGISYSSIHGTLTPDEVEARLAEWRSGNTHALIGKPVMLGQGMNLQQCHTAIYIGVTFKFNDLIQSIHRIQRYGQTHICDVHLIHADTEREIRAAILTKWRQHTHLTDTMSRLIREHGLSTTSVHDALTRTIGVTRKEATGDGWKLALNDTVLETRAMATGSVDLIVTSIPFANHYEYTPSYNDFGHTDNNAHFWAQMDYLTPELLRVLAPGRIYACHVKDRILFGNVTGAGLPTVSPFHAEAIFHATRHGFDYIGMITVVTDVVRENNQTYRLSYGEMLKDSTKMGVGSPEYVLLFHAPQTDRTRGYADTPVRKGTKQDTDYSLARWQIDAHAFWRSSGNRHLTPDELAALPISARARLFTEQTLASVYDYAEHVAVGELLAEKGALPSDFMSLAPGSADPMVWHDVVRMRTLNTEQGRRGEEQHLCPLQLDIVERLIRRFSAAGDLVYDPFAGVGTVPLVALQMGRRGAGTELNPGYWADGCAYLREQEAKRSAPTLFDVVSQAEDGAA